MLRLIMLYILISCLLTFVVAKKGKKKVKNTKPDFISQENYCAACAFILEYSLEKLHGSKHEYDIVDVMDGICQPSDELATNPYIPPDQLIEACEAFIGNWEDKIVLHLMKREIDDTDVVTMGFCGKPGQYGGQKLGGISAACKDARPFQMPQPPDPKDYGMNDEETNEVHAQFEAMGIDMKNVRMPQPPKDEIIYEEL